MATSANPAAGISGFCPVFGSEDDVEEAGLALEAELVALAAAVAEDELAAAVPTAN